MGGVLALGLVLGAEAILRRREAVVQLLPHERGRLYGVWPGTHGTNSHGFHDREWPGAKEKGERRIVVVGDSMTWGTGTAEDAWTRIAEDGLGEGWRVLNLSTYGYDAAQERATLRATGTFEADLVVVAAYQNDLIPTRTVELRGWPIFVGERGGWFPTARRHSAVVRALEGAVEHRRGSEREDADAFAEALRGIANDIAPTQVFAWVIPPHALAGGNDACIAVAPVGACERAIRRTRQIIGIAESLKIPHVEVLTMLRKRGAETFFETAEDWEHPNADGRRAIGEAFASVIRASELARPDGDNAP